MAPEPNNPPKAVNKPKGGPATSRAPSTTEAGKYRESKSSSKVETAKSTKSGQGRAGAVSGREISRLGTESKKTSAADNKCDIQLTKEMSRELTANGWYHGMMPREDIEELLVNEGDFLVRKTEVKGKSKISLGVRYHGSPRHFLFEYENGEWSLKNVKKKSLAELVEHLVKNKTALHSDGCALVTPVPRPDYYILHEDVDIKQKLGRGAFGEVHMGVIKRGNEEIKVAVKKLRGMIGKKQQKAFLKESRIMRRCEHRNVTRLIGVAVQEEPVLIVLELAEFGALNDFLKKNPETPKEKLTDFAKDACRGMTYLSGRDIIHRDLAARNCLLGKDTNGGSVAKISDFGLSVSDADIVQLRQLRSIPVKWCAPETLTKGVYTTKTDVWSFGNHGSLERLMLCSV
ncbi:TK/FER protein kinase [Aphelenchoides avenae]|nr:TK/FER protein kinase [Aphelenchus avenae]